MMPLAATAGVRLANRINELFDLLLRPNKRNAELVEIARSHIAESLRSVGALSKFWPIFEKAFGLEKLFKLA